MVKRHRLKDLNRGTFLHDFGRRLLALPSHTMRAFADQVDVQACRALLLVIAIYLLAGLVGAFHLGRRRATPAGRVE